jgi:PHD/YefM family antitoxin component YafN of YafNO toxin-antitoxin module
MKKLTLKETQAPYEVALDDTSEVVILERNGEPVAAIVPIAEYRTFQTWRQAVDLPADRSQLG